MFSKYFEIYKLRYAIAFRYSSNKFWYKILKTLCIIIFALPCFWFDVCDVLFNLVFYIPSRLPIICIPAKVTCLIVDIIDSLIFTLLILADFIFRTKNIEILQNVESL